MNKAKYLILLPLFSLVACASDGVKGMSIDEVKNHLDTFQISKMTKVDIHSYVSFGQIEEEQNSTVDFLWDNLDKEIGTVNEDAPIPEWDEESQSEITPPDTRYPGSPVSVGLPMYVKKDNYIVMTKNSKGEEIIDILNSFHYVLNSLLIYTDSTSKMTIEKTENDGLVFYVNNTSTYYAAFVSEGKASGHARFNIRFEYDNRGFLIKELVHQVETKKGEVGKNKVWVEATYAYHN